MSRNIVFNIFLTAFLVLFIQILIPAITFYSLRVVPDILIIFICYIGFYYGRFYAIIVGFILGFSQDLITQLELMGAMAFTKSVLGFGLGSLNLYPNIWSRGFKLFFIFIVYCLHFFIFYFIKFNGLKIDSLIVAKIIIINSLISFFMLIVIDKIVFDSALVKDKI